MTNATQSLMTDLYQLTMGAGYFHRGLHDKRVSFELFVRRLPRNRRYLVFAGLEPVLEHLRGLRFTESQIGYLRQVPALRPAMTFEFTEFLRGFRFRGDVDALPEGSVAFGRGPLLRVTGSLFEAQLVETHLLSVVNSQTSVATRAARVKAAAEGRAVLEFGTRRTSPEEAAWSARSAYLAGFDATSNVEAGYRWDLPLAGTAAHSWTMAHDSEAAAFEGYLSVYPAERTTLLVDTYDTLEGVRRAIAAANGPLGAIRLDSGDLGALAQQARAILDAAGRTETKIVATGDLNEYRIRELLAGGAPIDVFGVGTELVRVTDSPHLGGVYKLVEDHSDGRVVAKQSEGKVTLPGRHQVYRVLRDGVAQRDVIGTLGEFHVDAQPLLQPWMAAGELTRPLPSIAEVRAHCRAQLGSLPAAVHDLSPTEPGDETYPVTLSDALETLIEQVAERA